MRTQVPYILVPKYIASACVIKERINLGLRYFQWGGGGSEIFRGSLNIFMGGEELRYFLWVLSLSDRAAKPARQCQLKCLFEMKNYYLTH